MTHTSPNSNPASPFFHSRVLLLHRPCAVDPSTMPADPSLFVQPRFDLPDACTTWLKKACGCAKLAYSEEGLCC
ncbi:hypothetical protein EJB05_43798, partial [Eragrostis curvula]